MNEYLWHGLDNTHRPQQGICQAPSKHLARVLLLEQGITVQKLVLKPKAANTSGRISKTLLMHWIQQLYSFLSAGIALYEAISLSDKGQNHAKMHALNQHILTAMQSGQAFSQALAQSPYALPPMLVRMAAIGEKTGKLQDSLNLLSRFWQTQETQRKALQKAARYPLIVLFCACLISLGMLLYLVPQFAIFYTQQQAPLPELTLWMIALSNTLLHHGALGGVLVLCTAFGIRYAYRNTLSLQRNLAALCLRIPKLGNLYQARLCADWAQAMAMMLASGIPMRDALSHTHEQSQNLLFCEALARLLTCIESGQSLHQGLQENPLFPEFTAHFVRLGEETGEMLPVLQHLHQHYAGLVTHSLEQISSYVEPVLMLLTGVIIGTVVLAMYLPIFSMGAAL